MKNANNKTKEKQMVTINNSLSPEVLRRAADLAESIRTQQDELNRILSGQVDMGAPQVPTVSLPRMSPIGGNNRRFSPDARAKISAAQRRRWARVHKAQRAAEAARLASIEAQTTPAPAIPAVATTATPAPEPVVAPAPVTPAPVTPVAAAPAPVNHKKGHKVAAA